jgi:hypothetical protein
MKFYFECSKCAHQWLLSGPSVKQGPCEKCGCESSRLEAGSEPEWWKPSSKTIDGVPRATLANFIEYSVPVSQDDQWYRDKQELRALLDEPACKTCNGLGHVPDGEITGSGGVEFENGPVECVKDCPVCKPAAQPQGDGVNWKGVADQQKEIIEQQQKLIASLRAELAESYRIDGKPQAEPVAVVLPERMPTGNNVEGEHNRLSPGFREGWNAYDAEYKRLNRG